MENICKFNPYRSSDLICQDFVLETNNAQAAWQTAQQYAIHLVIEGEGLFICDGKQYMLTAGTLFFVCRGERFSVASSQDLRYSYISFYGRRAEEYRERLRLDSENRVVQENEELITFWKNALAMACSSNIDLISEAVLMYSLAGLEPQRKTPADVIDKVISLTHEQFTDPELSISSVADQLGYDAKYLSSLFKKRKSVAYTRYLQQLRIKHAVFLMEAGVASVKNVALLSGFRDAFYFSKVFSSVEGISPKSYILQISANKI